MLGVLGLNGKLGVIISIILVIIFLVGFGVIVRFFSIWVRALFSGARVTYIELLALWLRKVPVGYVVDNRITAVKA